MPRRKIPHFNLYPSNFLDGTRDMSGQEVGDYIRLLCLMYDHEGPIDFDPAKLRLLLGCIRRPDCVKRIQRLIDLGKILVDADGKLHNPRVDEELRKRADWQKNIEKKARVEASITPSISAEWSEKSAKKTNKNKDRGNTRARIQNPDKEKKEKKESAAPPQVLNRNSSGWAALGVPLLNGGTPSPPPEPQAQPPPREIPDYSHERIEPTPALERTPIVAGSRNKPRGGHGNGSS